MVDSTTPIDPNALPPTVVGNTPIYGSLTLDIATNPKHSDLLRRFQRCAKDID